MLSGVRVRSSTGKSAKIGDFGAGLKHSTGWSVVFCNNPVCDFSPGALFAWRVHARVSVDSGARKQKGPPVWEACQGRMMALLVRRSAVM